MLFSGPTGSNVLDGGSPFYAVYQCQGGGWFTLGALEPQFYEKFLKTFLAALPPSFTVTNLERGPNWRPTPQNQGNKKEWGDLRKFIEAGFLTKTRDEWTSIFDGMRVILFFHCLIWSRLNPRHRCLCITRFFTRRGSGLLACGYNRPSTASVIISHTRPQFLTRYCSRPETR